MVTSMLRDEGLLCSCCFPLLPGMTQFSAPFQARKALICGPTPKLLIEKVCLRFGANG